MQGTMSASDILGTSLLNSHPFSFNKLKDQADLVASLISKGQTQDPLQKVTLINGNVECESCHNPHVQNGDAVSLNFLVRNSVGRRDVSFVPRNRSAHGEQRTEPAGSLAEQCTRD